MDGWVRPPDNTWLVPIHEDEHGDTIYGFISKDAMDFLMKKESEDTK